MGGRLEFAVCMEKKDDANARTRGRVGEEEGGERGEGGLGLKSVSQRLNK